MSKPRSDSWLRNLPAERQEQVIEWCTTPKSDECSGGYAFAREQLLNDGIKVSLGTLSDFYSWYHLREDFRRTDALTSDFEELLKREFPTADAKKIQEFGQSFFSLQAMAKQDPKEFREMEYLRLSKETAETKGRQKDQEIELATRRVAVLENKITEAKEKLTKVIAASKGGLSAETLKQIESAAKILS